MRRFASPAIWPVFTLLLIVALFTFTGCSRAPSGADVPPVETGQTEDCQLTAPDPALEEEDEQAGSSPAAIPPIQQSPPVAESTHSPLKIVIYTDFECGACGKLNAEVEPELHRLFVSTGKVEIEIRLIGALSDESMLAAQAALCADDQGKFAEYKDALFHAWNEEEDIALFSIESLAALGASLGLDEAALTDCLEGEAWRAEIEENMIMAQADNVRTLPAFLAGNVTIQGYKPLDTYIQTIETLLAAQ